MPTIQQDQNFQAHMKDTYEVSPNALNKAIQYISKNLDPVDVFTGKLLCDFVQKSYTPDEVFPAKELQEWAENNGYIKE